MSGFSGDRTPVTVGELVDVLATYPRESLVLTDEAGTGAGSIKVEIDGVGFEVWDGMTSAGNWHKPERVPFESHRPRRMVGGPDA